MAKWVALALLQSIVAALGATFEWPALAYDGRPREAAWLEKAYQELKEKIVHVEGVYFNLMGAEGGELALGNCFSTDVTVNRVLAGGDLVVGVEGGRIVYLKGVPPGKYADGSKFRAALLVVGTQRYRAGPRPKKGARTIYSCCLVPDERAPVTREQFVEAIGSGMQLYFWETCPQCNGSRSIYKKVWRDSFPGSLHKEQVSVKEPCPRCGATGRLRIKEIRKPPQAKPDEKADVDDADNEPPAK